MTEEETLPYAPRQKKMDSQWRPGRISLENVEGAVILQKQVKLNND